MIKPEFTISNSTGNNAEKHSRRYYIPFSADESLTQKNIVIYDCGDDREHLNSTARPYIIAYNSRQKRKDRMKDYEDDYVGALENGRACYGKGDKKEKPFHHDVIQIGNRDVLGITDSDFDVKHWRELKRDGKKKEASGYVDKHLNKDRKVDEAIQILKEVAEEIMDGRYSNILVHGLIIHADEPNGTPHLDFRYSIFTEGEKTGVPWRISDHKGLAKMGFVTQTKKASGQDEPAMFTALQKFRESINVLVEEKMLEHGWERKYLNEHRKHLSTAQFEAEKTLTYAEQKSNEMISEAEDLYDVYMEEMESGRRKLDREKQELSELRTGLSEFLSSNIGQQAYREYIDSIGGLSVAEIPTARKKKQGGKVKVPNRDLRKELERIDENIKTIPHNEMLESDEEFDIGFDIDEIDDTQDMK